MRKCRKVPILIFYIAYFVCNFIISFALLRGWFNPNISPTSSIGMIILSSLGDLGALSLFFCLTLILFKSDKNRVRMLTFLSLIFTLFIIFLQVFANIFSTFFSYSQLVSFKNPAQGDLLLGYTTYILNMFKYKNILFPIIIYLFLFIFHFFIKYEKINKRKVKNRLFNISTSLLTMTFPVFLCSISIVNSADSLSMNSIYGCSYMGTYNYYIYSLNELFGKDVTLDENKKMKIEQFLEEHKYVESNNIEHNSKNKNLIVLQMEAINNFVINLELDGELITPNLTALAYDNYYNNRFYSAAGMGNTSDCEFASIIGLYPNGNDMSIFEIEGEHYPTIAKEFSELGYDTFSIHGNEGGFYNRDVQHIKLFGFDEHIDREKLLNRNKNLKLIKNWVCDESLLEESINIYKEKENPFCSYNILVTSHGPFSDDKNIDQYQNEKLTNKAEDYISYVKYVDSAIGKFIQDLKDNNLYEDSVIIMYGDHTSSLLKQDVMSITNKKYQEDVEFRIEMQNVPFIMLGKNIPTVIDNNVHSNIDIFPTLDYLFDFSIDYHFGVNMLTYEETFAYNPRSLDLIYNDFVIQTPSKEVYYSTKDIEKLTSSKIKELINDFKEYKYANDLLVYSDYYK